MTGLAQVREQARQRFSELGFPTTRQEAWRFTNVAPIAKTRFQAAPALVNGWAREHLETAHDPANGGLSVVFVNGRCSPELSTRKLPAGIVCESLGKNGGARAHLARHASYQDQPFVAWNTAEFEDGAYIEIPDRVVLSEPIHLIFLSGGSAQPFVSHPRILVVAGSGSQATLVESYFGKGSEYLTNAVTEIVGADNAVIDHYKVQREDEESFHVAATQVQLGRDANYSSHSISLGGRLVRNDVNAVLAEGAHATVNGLYLVDGTQHVDNHTSIEHAKPHGTSTEIYKGILDGRASAVFNGRIRVEKDAQKIDSKQTNKNLVLSEDATINTKPELEIFADDVRCTHGATIGQLDRDAIFYLQSRGISQGEARELLTHAFTRDITDRIKVAPLRSRLEQAIWEKLHARRN